MSRSRTPIGVERPRLSRTDAWGYWHVTTDGSTLVFDRRDSGNYQVPLDDLRTLEDARLRVGEVVALKDAWADQRVVDDLRRALRALKGFNVPEILVEDRQH